MIGMSLPTLPRAARRAISLSTATVLLIVAALSVVAATVLIVPPALLHAQQPAAAPAAERSIGQASQDRAAEIDAILARFHETGRFNGSVLVAEAGEVICKRGLGYANMEWEVPNTPDTKFRIGSVTKQFTAVLILQLVEEGKLSLDGTIRDYLPDYPSPQGDQVTVHHLLNHTSGIPSYTGLPGFMQDEVRDPYAPDSLVALFSGMELEFEPGTRWRYNNSGYHLLGVIIERVTGQPYEVVLRERLLDPLGLRDTGYDHNREVRKKGATGYTRTLAGYEDAAYLDSSVPYAAGMMYSTVEDLFRWDQALYARDARILGEADSWERMFTPGLSDYGYGWQIREVPIGDDGATVKIIEHGGGIFGFSTAFRRFPNERNTIVAIDNTGGNVGRVVSAITQILYGQPAEPPRASIAERILPVIESSGADAGIQRYHDLKRRSADSYDFAESELNTLGYYLLRQGDVQAAIKIFRLNVEQFPEAWNTFDSLGEGLLAAGDTVGAIDNYLKSIELNPANLNGINVLEELEVEIDTVLLTPYDDVPLSVLDSYVGTYEIEPGVELEVRHDNGRLFAQVTDQAEVELFARTQTRFFVRAAPIQLEFNYTSDDEVDSVTLYQSGQQIRARRIR